MPQGAPCKPFKRMAGTTRLELATSAVTGQRSNQLNYVPTPVLNQFAENLGGQDSRESRREYRRPSL